MKTILTLFITFLAVACLHAKKITPVAMAVYEASASKKLRENPSAESKGPAIRVTVAWGYHPKLQVFDERDMDVPSGSTIAEVAALWQKETGDSLFAPVFGSVVVLRKNGSDVERVSWSVKEIRTSGRAFVLQKGDVLISVGSEIY